MPTYDKAIISEQARQLGFLTAPFEKMIRLAEILRFFNETDELRGMLALKGGTAINLTVFKLPRLSVDVDLDFNINLSKEETYEKRDKINDLLGLYMSMEGYGKKEKSKRTHILDSYVYTYTNVSGNADNIKVEINYSLRSHILASFDVITQTTGVLSTSPILILSPIEIFASKIVALSSRAAARDLYDINNMVFYGLFNKSEMNLLRKCAVFYLAIAGENIENGFNFQRLANITKYKIKTELQPMIRYKEKFDLRAAHDRVTSFLDEHMLLNEMETAFLKNFSLGQYEPKLLFDDNYIIERIKCHPMVVWRLRHIRQIRHE